ncbi:alpha/beta fold hydrolase [Glaciimonas soli]|uniref:Alpha/beta fold hydrolase n=1 Tax=Glaciimonas soli TaxID=2590999 RepID=A0A843YX44_9BURK|nr:alpha/beta hydrolase [Glaciimonas soli]MQR02293.1 alpha/beta fold hydrolase [Glaciimonas soli]
MTSFQSRFVASSSPAGTHTVHYKEWGDINNPRVLLCLHGLVRASGDFDFIAQELAQTYRIICPDLVGRGLSDRLADPQYYQVEQYVKDVVTLLDDLQLRQFSILGTSLGGIVAMVLASLSGYIVTNLILNDVGMALRADAMRALGTHVAQNLQFSSFDEAAAYVQKISAGVGPHSAAQWQVLASNALRQSADGAWELHYDPALSVPLLAATQVTAQQGEQALWKLYDALSCRVLLIRGEQSTMLSRETAMELTQRGPRAALVEVVGVGHAPTFLHREQVALVRDFLAA